MRTLVRTSMIVSLALVLVCMTVPFGHTQEVTMPKTPCDKCGTATPIGKWPPGSPQLPTWHENRFGTDIKDFGGLKPSWTLPGNSTDPAQTLGQSPAWPADNKDNGKPTVFPNCGKTIPVDQGIKNMPGSAG